MIDQRRSHEIYINLFIQYPHESIIELLTWVHLAEKDAASACLPYKLIGLFRAKPHTAPEKLGSRYNNYLIGSTNLLGIQQRIETIYWLRQRCEISIVMVGLDP